MLAFIIAGIVFVGTLVICAFIFFADMMSDAPSEPGIPFLTPFIIGTIIAVLIAASHWLPHLGW